MVTTKDKIRALDMPVLDQVFEMSSGYVLNFSDRTFAEFFYDELGINIDDPRYAQQGGSKGKRLRFFLRNADRALALKTLNALWEYRTSSKLLSDDDELPPKIATAFFAIIKRLGGSPLDAPEPAVVPQEIVDQKRVADLSAQLVAVSQLAPHQRGYAFEKFLKDLFDVYGLAGRASFRIQGEQIDGSFVLANQTYLLEAKWTNTLVDAATLRSFNAKVEDKAKWSRGLFVSQSGFSEDGLAAFGRGNSVICVDGLDLYEILSQGLSFPDVIAMKVRRAAETGQPFIRVRELNFSANPKAP